MSQKEADQIGIFEKLKHKEISQIAAASALCLSVRHLRRKQEEYLKYGPLSLAHSARGKPSNRKLPQEKIQGAVRIVREKYADFGPTFACEKLLEDHSLKIGKETLRGLMITEGLWKPKVQVQKPVHQWRERRASLGELVQCDGSHHRWLEGRASPCCLIAFIDDASSEVLHLELCESESTISLFEATRHYLEARGRPCTIYTDRGGVFKVNLGNRDDERITQFERALNELAVGLIHARSPQAKGRVERLFGTLQDRLVKELRLKCIATIEEANNFLKETYLPAHNAKFAIAPKQPVNLHRGLTGLSLPHIFSLASTRILQGDWCLSYKKRWLQVGKTQQKILTKGASLEIREQANGEIHLWFKGVELAFSELSARPTKPLREKQLDLRHVGHKPATTHPWKQFEFDYSSKKPDISKWLEPDISILV